MASDQECDGVEVTTYTEQTKIIFHCDAMNVEMWINTDIDDSEYLIRRAAASLKEFYGLDLLSLAYDIVAMNQNGEQL